MHSETEGNLKIILIQDSDKWKLTTMKCHNDIWKEEDYKIFKRKKQLREFIDNFFDCEGK